MWNETRSKPDCVKPPKTGNGRAPAVERGNTRTRDFSRVSNRTRRFEILPECTGAFPTGNPTEQHTSSRDDWKVRCLSLPLPRTGSGGRCRKSSAQTGGGIRKTQDRPPHTRGRTPSTNLISRSRPLRPVRSRQNTRIDQNSQNSRKRIDHQHIHQLEIPHTRCDPILHLCQKPICPSKAYRSRT
jgi:hypothetical protein